MTDTSATFPGTGGNNAVAGDVAWTSTGNIVSSNNVRATCALRGEPFQSSQYLRASNFGFAIPAGATINGIKVEWEKKADFTNELKDTAIRIVKADGSIGTTDKSSAVNWPLTEAFTTYGGATDLWGETWTSADINDVDFGSALRVVVISGGGDNDPLVDSCRITISYTEKTGTNMQVNIGDAWKTVAGMQINIGDAWKTVAGAKVNIGDVWKTIF